MGRAARRRTAGLPVPHRNTKDTPFPTWPQIQERGGAKTQAQRPHAQGPQARALTALASVSSSALLALFLSFSVSLLASPVLPLHFLSLLLSLFVADLSLSLRVCLPPSWSRCLSRGLRAEGPRPHSTEAAGRAGRPGAQRSRLAPAGRPGAAGGLRWAQDERGRRVLPAGQDARSGAPGGVWGGGVRGAACGRGTRVPPPLSAAICRHLTAFHLRSDRN